MRLIDLDASEVRTVAVSPDGRFLAASGAGGWLYVLDWASGEPVRRLPLGVTCDQFAFGPEGWLAYVHHTNLRIDALDATAKPKDVGGNFAGGIAVTPDGRAFVAARAGVPNQAKLDKWTLPGLRREAGFELCSPFRRLVFSPDGVYLAGIWPGVRGQWRSEPGRFELRYAASGGLDHRYPPLEARNGPVFGAVGFISFSHDSATCVFGWEDQFHVLDISTGTSTRREGSERTVRTAFRDAAFTGSGHLFATVEDTGVLKMWDPQSWQVLREYDWGVGPLTSLAFTADGTAGVCGTAGGQLVQFDVDE